MADTRPTHLGLMADMKRNAEKLAMGGGKSVLGEMVRDFFNMPSALNVFNAATPRGHAPSNVYPNGTVRRAPPHILSMRFKTVRHRSGKVVRIYRGLDHVTAQKLAYAKRRRQLGRWAQ